MSEELWRPAWHHDDVEIKEANLAYDGFFKVKRLLLRHKCFSGKWSDWLVREQIRRSDAAAVLLYDPARNKVIMVEQFRVGISSDYRQKSPWLLEIVAGLQDRDETPEQTVVREALEEAACEIKQLIRIGEFLNTPGGFAEKTTLFCGICDAPARGGIQGVGDEHEDIQVHILPVPEIISAMEKGEIVTSASTVIAVQWLAYQLKKDGLSSLLQH